MWRSEEEDVIVLRQADETLHEILHEVLPWSSSQSIVFASQQSRGMTEDTE